LRERIAYECAELKTELHRIIDQVKDNGILQVIHTMPSSHVSILAHTPDGKPMTNDGFNEMLRVPEDDIQYGRLIHQKRSERRN
jgi:hypothetical protein